MEYGFGYIIYSKIPIYPIFYLLKGDYNSSMWFHMLMLASAWRTKEMRKPALAFRLGFRVMRAVKAVSPKTLNPKPWVLPPHSNSWIMITIWLYIALKRTPTIDCYWVGAVPNLNPKEVSVTLRSRISDCTRLPNLTSGFIQGMNEGVEPYRFRV